jgi:hypothetical protein
MWHNGNHLMGLQRQMKLFVHCCTASTKSAGEQLLQLVMRQGIKDHDLSQSVQQFQPEVLAHLHKHTRKPHEIQHHIADQGSFKK